MMNDQHGSPSPSGRSADRRVRLIRSLWEWSLPLPRFVTRGQRCPRSCLVCEYVAASFLLAAVLGSGCARNKAVAPEPATALTGSTNTPTKFIVSPEDVLAGKVIQVNTNARFVVLNFPIGLLPAVDQRLAVYRRRLKVADVEVNRPHRDDDIVAGIIEGTILLGDAARNP